MKKTTKLGFTLVELLVVISIIGMLAGLLLPAVQQAREAGRRAVCMSNQRQLALACQSYNSAKNKLPQFAVSIKMDEIPADSNSEFVNASWIAQLLPYTENVQLWDNFVKNGSKQNIELQYLTCPSNSSDNSSNSFVANCGYNDAPYGTYAANSIGDVTKTNGMFNDGRRYDVNGVTPPTADEGEAQAKALSLDDIVDGTSNTILLSENIQAGGLWDEEEYKVGFCWPYENAFNSVTDCASLATSLETSYTGTEPPLKINRCQSDISGSLKWITARASSAHPGIIVTAFADGSMRNVNEFVEKEPLMRAMCPNDKKSYAAKNGFFVMDGVLDLNDLN